MPYYVDLVLRYNILFFLILDYSIIYNMTTDALHEIILYNAHTYTHAICLTYKRKLLATLSEDNVCTGG